MGNDKITLAGDVTALQNVIVNGSPTHSDFATFQQTFNPLVQKLTTLSQTISAKPDTKREDTLMIQYTAAFEKVKKTIDDFIATKKSSPVAPFVLLVTSEIEQDITAVERRYNLLAPAQQQGFYGKILKGQIADSRIGAVGTDALTFVQNDTMGRPIALSSFKGKYVLIDFWASWCKPCRIENPNVVAAYNRFKSKNFTVLGVSLDRSKEPWIKAIHDDELKWTHVSDLQYWNNAVAQLYKVEGIPQNFLVDPNGKIVGKNLRGEQLHEKLCELLGCNN
ncbi:MAG: TlpA family protein disulfide reductase [Chitinophagaceae bacterium]|nr:TlpA family protein disulfide reductase [Chitinophagaceae bacterium]